MQRELIENNVHEQEVLWLTREGDHDWEHQAVRLLDIYQFTTLGCHL